jgi:hypothetical protein
VEELTEHELDRILQRYEAMARKAREQLRRGKPDTGSPDLQSAGSETE